MRNIEMDRRTFIKLTGALALKAVLPASTPQPYCESKALSTNGTPVVVAPGRCEKGWPFCCNEKGEWKPNVPLSTPVPIPRSPTSVPRETEENNMQALFEQTDGLLASGLTGVLVIGGISLFALLAYRDTVGKARRGK